MIFADLVNGDSVFLDANVLIYQFGPHPQFGPACHQLMQRIENQDLLGFTSTHILTEVAHRLMTIEAATLAGWSSSQVTRRLRQQPATIQKLARFRVAIESILNSRIQVLSIPTSLILSAVTIEPLSGIYFVSDRPEECAWEVQEGVELELTPLFGTWTPDLGPLQQVLCVSNSGPKYYRVFKNPRDVGPLGYRPTGRRFGGLFPKAKWERFAKEASSSWILRALADDQPAEATQEIVGATR